MLIWLNCLFYPPLFIPHMSMFANNVLLVRVGLGLWFGLEKRYSHTMETVVQAKQLLWLTVGQV